MEDEEKGLSRGQTTIRRLGIGLVAGFIGGLLGIGGGVFMVPALVGWLRLDQHKAHGTSLAVTACNAAASVIVYSLHGSVNVLLASQLLAGSMVGAFTGAKLMNMIPAALLRKIFGVFLLVIALRMLLG